MKRTTFFLIALALAVSALAALDQGAAAAPKPTYVVVDPMDLRKPVPDPEQGLTQKYDGQVVRFTGVLARATQDKKTKKFHYEMHYILLNKTTPPGKKVSVVTKETIVVPVTFGKDNQQFRIQNRNKVITVEGKGSIMTEGTLFISDAVIVPNKGPFEKK